MTASVAFPSHLGGSRQTDPLGSPLMDFRRASPPTSHCVYRSRSSQRLSHRRRIAKCIAGSVLVVSHHLNGLFHTPLVGLLHPTAGPRFSPFHSAGPTSVVRRHRVGSYPRSPSCSFIPLEEFPSPTAVQRHRCRCLHAVHTAVILVIVPKHNSVALLHF